METEDARKEVDSWMETVRRLRMLVSDSTLFLPAYDAEQAQQTLARLVFDVQEARNIVLPRKKFHFRKRSRLAPPTGSKRDNGEADNTARTDDALASKWDLDERERAVESISDRVIVIGPLPDGCEAEHLPPHDQVDLEDGHDVRLTDLSACVIFMCVCIRSRCDSRRSAPSNVKPDFLSFVSLRPLFGRTVTTGAIRVDRLQHCYVVATPVQGSVLLHDCTDSVFHLSSRQIRLHRSTKCDFFLRVLSRPIIEHCDEVRVAPFMLSFPGLVSAWRRAGLSLPPRAAALSEETPSARVSHLRANWAHVDDFGWHRARQSPHWSIVPAEERAGAVKLPPSLATLCVQVGDSAWADEPERTEFGGSAGDGNDRPEEPVESQEGLPNVAVAVETPWRHVGEAEEEDDDDEL